MSKFALLGAAAVLLTMSISALHAQTVTRECPSTAGIWRLHRHFAFVPQSDITTNALNTRSGERSVLGGNPLPI